MDICKGINGSFICAHMLSSFLRADLSARQRCMVRALCSEHRVNGKKLAYLCMIMVADGPFTIYAYLESFSNETVPETTLVDVLYGSVKCEVTFEVFVLKSHIPPYKNYTCTCKMLKSRCTKMRAASEG